MSRHAIIVELDINRDTREDTLYGLEDFAQWIQDCYDERSNVADGVHIHEISIWDKPHDS